MVLKGKIKRVSCVLPLAGKNRRIDDSFKWRGECSLVIVHTDHGRWQVSSTLEKSADSQKLVVIPIIVMQFSIGN